MKKILMAALVVAAASGMVGCDSPTESSAISVVLTVTPDPAVAVESSGVWYEVIGSDSKATPYEYQYKTTFTVTAKEQEGHACNITAVNATIQQASGGIIVTTSKPIYSEYTFRASNNHLAANASVDTSVTVFYTLPSAGKEALVTVSMSFKDDDGYTAAQSVEVKVAP